MKPFQGITLACHVVLGLIGAWALAALIALGVQCNQPEPWNFGADRCVNQHALYIGLTVVHILLDVVVIILPVIMLFKVQMSKKKRFKGSVLFVVRVA